MSNTDARPSPSTLLLLMRLCGLFAVRYMPLCVQGARGGRERDVRHLLSAGGVGGRVLDEGPPASALDTEVARGLVLQACAAACRIADAATPSTTGRSSSGCALLVRCPSPRAASVWARLSGGRSRRSSIRPAPARHASTGRRAAPPASGPSFDSEEPSRPYRQASRPTYPSSGSPAD